MSEVERKNNKVDARPPRSMLVLWNSMWALSSILLVFAIVYNR